MASLHRIALKGRRWAYQLHYYVDGKRRTEYFPHGVDIKLILARKKAVEAALVLHKVGIKKFGEQAPGSSISLLELSERVAKARERDVSRFTLKRNAHGMNLLMKYLGAHLPVDILKQEHIDGFKRWRHETAVNRAHAPGKEIDGRRINRGINHDLAEIKTVFHVAVKKGIIPPALCPTISFVVTDRRRLPVFLSIDEVHRIAEFLDWKARLAFYLIYYTGARRGEIVRQRTSDRCGLKWGDVDLIRGAIKLYGKRKERVVPIIPDLLKILEAARRLLGNPSEDQFVIDFIGDTLTQKFRAAMVAAGVNKPGAVHLLRHSLATHMLDADIDLRTVQEWLGHESIVSTQIYTHVTQQRLENAAKLFEEKYGKV